MDLWKAVEKLLNDYYDTCSKLDVGTGPAGNMLPTIFEKAAKNPKFRKRLLTSPIEVLAQEGFSLPKGFNLKFVEETEDAIYLPLLPFVGEGYQKGKNYKPSALDEIIQRANTDMDFRRQLILTPKPLLSTKGFEIDPQKKVKVLECTDDIFYAILPAAKRLRSATTESAQLIVLGNTIYLSGRLDAVSVEKVRDTFLNWEGDLRLDLKKLDFISSAGLALFLTTLKRLDQSSNEIRLLHIKPAVRNVFVLAGFDTLFNL